MVETDCTEIRLAEKSKSTAGEKVKGQQIGIGGGAFMKQFGIQMIDNSISSQWWKTIMKYFVKIGNSFEIRCWKEEAAEIESASLYGVAVDDKCEVSIKGSVTKELLEKLLIEEPTDKSIYNKMTKYFTIHVENDLCNIWSEHYGTEMVIDVISDADIEFLEKV